MSFAAAICEKHYAEAVNIIRTDIESGSPVAVINVDDPMAVGTETVRNLLNLAMATPEIARVPVVVFSSEWKTLETAMQCVQGKPLIGPLTLAEGDEVFVRYMSLADRYGTAVWIALIDEQGIADTLDRKRSVAQRITALLEQSGFPQDSVAAGDRLFGYSQTVHGDCGRTPNSPSAMAVWGTDQCFLFRVSGM
jgi:5-methyltetrahydrofolate--homocysteine methyltransferase